MGGSHAHHGHGTSRLFALAALLNLAYTVVEAIYGFRTDSLALLSDAVHNLGDVAGLGLAWAATKLAERPPTTRHTYGWRRATLLSPLVNAAVLVLFSGALGWEAMRRFSAPPAVPGTVMMIVAAIGIAVNLAGAWLLRDDGGHGHAHDLNRRGAFLHLMADAAVSLAAVLAGLGIRMLGWNWLDPLTALLVSVVILVGSWRLLRDSFDASMDAVPRHLDQGEVVAFLQGQPGVVAVHHVHVWSIGSSEIALTAHLVRPEGSDGDGFIAALTQALDSRFGINHATLQLERETQCHQPDHGHRHAH